MAPKRARGRAYLCACDEEKLHLTREGPDARHDGWSYLVGKCGGGVKLRFDRMKVVEWKAVDDLEVARVRALPARRLDAVDMALEALDARRREELDAIVADVRSDLLERGRLWVRIGQRLARAKEILGHGVFGRWVERNHMDRNNAYKFIAAWEMVRSAPPAIAQALGTLPQEIVVVLTRFPAAKRNEIVEHGVPINGVLKPLEQTTTREFQAFARASLGKSPRGRKPKDAPATKPTEKHGLPIELADPLTAVLRGLHAIKALVQKDRIPKKHVVAFGRLWNRIHRLTYELHAERGLGDLLEDVR